MATKHPPRKGSDSKIQHEAFGGPLDWQAWDFWAYAGSDIPENERPPDLNYAAVKAAVEREASRLHLRQVTLRAKGPARARVLRGDADGDPQDRVWIEAWQSVLSAHANWLSQLDHQARRRKYWSDQAPINYDELAALSDGLPAAAKTRLRHLSFEVNRTLNASAVGALFRKDLRATLAAFREHVQASKRCTLSVRLFDGTETEQAAYIDGYATVPQHLGGLAQAFVSPQAHAALEAFDLELRAIARFEATDHMSEDVVSAVQRNWPKKPRESKLRPELEECFDAVLKAWGEGVLKSKNITWVASKVSEEYARRKGVEEGPVYNTVLPVLMNKMPWHQDVASRRKSSN